MICSFRAEEDEEIAKRVNEEIIGEEAAMQRQRELADEVVLYIRLSSEGGLGGGGFVSFLVDVMIMVSFSTLS